MLDNKLCYDYKNNKKKKEKKEKMADGAVVHSRLFSLNETVIHCSRQQFITDPEGH